MEAREIMWFKTRQGQMAKQPCPAGTIGMCVLQNEAKGVLLPRLFAFLAFSCLVYLVVVVVWGLFVCFLSQHILTFDYLLGSAKLQLKAKYFQSLRMQPKGTGENLLVIFMRPVVLSHAVQVLGQVSVKLQRDFPVAQMVKNPPAMQGTWVQSLGWEDPLEEGMTTYCSNLAWRVPWTEEPGRLQTMGSQRVGKLSN